MGQELDLIKAYNLDRLDAPERLAALRSLMEQFGAPAIPLRHPGPHRRADDAHLGSHDRATPLSIAEEASGALDGSSASSTTPRTTRHWSSRRRS